MADSCINAQHRFGRAAFDDLHQGWFVFGTSAEPRLNLVDLNDGNDDVILNLKLEVAEEIIEIRRRYLTELYTALNKNWVIE